MAAAGAGIDLVVGEDRIRVELFSNLVNELQSGELQQPNGLLQLGRHDELLTEFELLLYFHVFPLPRLERTTQKTLAKATILQAHV